MCIEWVLYHLARMTVMSQSCHQWAVTSDCELWCRTVVTAIKIEH